MADLIPGTPEYQEAYDAEIKRLEANTPEAEKVPAEEPEPEKVEEPEKPSMDDELKQLKERLEKAEKIAKDNHAWGTKNAQELARLRKEREKEERARLRPEILDTVPGLEAAINHVAQPTPKTQGDSWLETVSRALPDINGLLEDKAFFDKVEAVKATLGSEWDDPVIAIRELSKASAQYVRDQAVASATEQARKDFEEKSKKLKGMSVPGGTSKTATKSADDEVQKYAQMSSEDVRKERARIMGY